MSSERLSSFRMHAALSQVGDEGMPKSVKIDYAALCVTHRDAGRSQINSKDVRELISPGKAENGLGRNSHFQVGAKSARR